MAQTWQAIIGATTYTINGGGSTWLVSAHGLGIPPIRRLNQRSPQQHGHTDLGYRYDARQIRLVFLAVSTSASNADTARDTSYTIWKAAESTPIKLKVTRDDASVRQIDCFVTGVVDMVDDLSERIGPSQRFVVTLEAADPMWYNPTQASTTFDATDNPGWWLALGTIASGEVEEYVTTPTQGQVTALSSNIPDGSPWTVFFRTNATSVAGMEYAFYFFGNTTYSAFGQYDNGSTNRVGTSVSSVTGVFANAEHDYFVISDGGTGIDVYRDGSLVNSVSDAAAQGIYNSGFGVSRWRSASGGASPWTPSVPNGAIYNIELTSDQRTSLTNAVDGDFAISKTISYAGSMAEYPVVTIVGPVTDPKLTNVSTGEKLDFTGITISGGNSYTIDCRFGYKTVKNAAGTNKIADLTSDSDLATFHLAPAPEVTDGDNAFTLTGSSTDSNTEVTVAYYNRYVGL